MWACKNNHHIEIESETNNICVFDYKNKQQEAYVIGFAMTKELKEHISKLFDSGKCPICDNWNETLPFDLPNIKTSNSYLDEFVKNMKSKDLDRLDQGRIDELF